MATVTEARKEWTIAALTRRFGSLPFSRIRHDPAPGAATEDDVLALSDREHRLYELVDGILVEKTMGWWESVLAMRIGRFLSEFVDSRRLGTVAGMDGMYRFSLGVVRIPDVSFVSNDRLPSRRIPHYRLCPVVPDLVVEVLSESNTRKEMEEKLVAYFDRGVRLVWYVDGKKEVVSVYKSPGRARILRKGQTLDGGDVLPGFTLPLRDLFADEAGGGTEPS